MSAADPWIFQRWAFGVKTGSPPRKAVLLALSIMADSSTGRCEAKVPTIMEQTELGERTVRTHLKGLETDRTIARRAQYRRDGMRRGDEYLLLMPGIDEWPDGEPVPALPVPQGGDETVRDEHHGGAASAATASPSAAGQEQPPKERPLDNDHLASQEARAQAERMALFDEGTAAPVAAGGVSTAVASLKPDPRDQVPGDFPKELHPHARQVMVILRGVAADHGTKKVWAKQLALTMLANPNRRYVHEARQFAVWAVDPGRPIKNVMSTYGGFLKRSDQIEGVEMLDGDGNPVFRPVNGRSRAGGNAAAVDSTRERTARILGIEPATSGVPWS